MNDPRHASVQCTYLYRPHLTHIHSAHARTGADGIAPGQDPAGLSVKSRYHGTLSAVPPALLPPHTQLLSQPQHPHPRPLHPARPNPTVKVSGPPSAAVQAHDSQRDPARAQNREPAQACENLHGRKAGPQSVRSSALPMTSNGAHSMGGKRDDAQPFARAQRPSIVSHHSNSVPSTPLQNARQYESRSRSPSPSGGLGSHSPRSVSSEANPATLPARIGRTLRCKYETSTQFGRRRMPYDSSDVLDKAKEEPKKTLNPHEDDKLSGDMRELYDRLQPTPENTKRRHEFVKKLQTILETEFPGHEHKVHVFGSSGNQLYTAESDVDVCIQTPLTRLEDMHPLAEALAKNGMEKVVCIPQAKVRIVKIWDPVLKLACDMNVNNTPALENTRMINTYIQIDERVRPLAMIIKHWTKERILNDAALGGTISSYTWMCMILNFLQTRNPPILPALHTLPYRAKDKTGKPSQSEFADDLDALIGFGSKNTESLGQLLFHFFRHYGHEVDYEKHVVSVREGRLLTREEKNWHRAGLQKEARNRLCVEEPFNTDRNLGNSADEFAWRGIHLELRRAFDFLGNGQQLGAACEQFEFPPAPAPEERPRPPKSTAAKVTLAPSVPNNRNGRNQGNHRGGRGGMNNKGGSYGRRASSGASFNRPPFLHSPPIGAMAGQQEYGFPQGLNDRLADHLYQQYQMLEMQSNSLRQQLVAQQRAQQAHQQAAHMHAQAVAQAQAQAQAQHNRGPSSSNASPQKSPYVNGRSSPRLAEAGIPTNTMPQGFLYHYPAFFDPSQQGSAVADGPRTNPSSPSLPHSMPGPRRQAHRSSNASETGSLRSQSQPARGMPQNAVMAGYPPMPYFDPSLVAGYPIARSTPEAPASQVTSDTPFSPVVGYNDAVPSETSIPREYVGYYVDEQATPRSLQEYTVPQIPSFNELVQRRRRVSSEITQPLLNTALRRVSRSPSPLGGHVRSYSTNVAQPHGQSVDSRNGRTDSVRPPGDSGPVIVNGSFPQQPLETRSRSDTIDSFQSIDTTSSANLGVFNDQDQYRNATHEQRQALVMEEMQRQRGDNGHGAAYANGSMNGVSPVDVNGLTRVPSGNQQYYSMLPEAWMNYELSNNRRVNQTEDISPTKTQPSAASQWRNPPYNNALATLDTLNAPRAPPQEIKSATLPLLSPVFETRTPSPTVNRQAEGSKLVNGAKTQSKENHHQPRRASHSVAQTQSQKENTKQQQAKNGPQPNDKNKSNASNNNNNSNNWHQQGSGRNKKRKNKGGNKSNDTKTSGEPLPANAADRKGG
ncbi:uncharacterized protein CC84DRAFT_1130906 [Paraphaeosphaeria sporulosa]|uniref:polynucleotide adenylyltransferase n=1 Tax=Paraphaeosphaeria sporulosa TaxID=1460663 RepID=A0A177BV44_9PLEO|nr:uncharacterized protein CC84DRAFT_1130906 [Paraphaeosphaeria sporulosa]OAF99184.1 hypothetical protein CC84DRAFT_1130906 [Paraphaeosphaeria sporulosa]